MMSLNLQRYLSFNCLPLIGNAKNVTSLFRPGMCEDKEGVSGVACQRMYCIMACSDAAAELLL